MTQHNSISSIHCSLLPWNLCTWSLCQYKISENRLPSITIQFTENGILHRKWPKQQSCSCSARLTASPPGRGGAAPMPGDDAVGPRRTLGRGRRRPQGSGEWRAGATPGRRRRQAVQWRAAAQSSPAEATRGRRRPRSRPAAATEGRTSEGIRLPARGSAWRRGTDGGSRTDGGGNVQKMHARWGKWRAARCKNFPNLSAALGWRSSGFCWSFQSFHQDSGFHRIRSQHIFWINLLQSGITTVSFFSESSVNEPSILF